jgi:hypothetical protein
MLSPAHLDEAMRAIVTRYPSGLNLGTAKAFVLYCRADTSQDPRGKGLPMSRNAGRSFLRRFDSKESMGNQIRPQLHL